MKTTPLWAVIHCTLAYLLHCFCFPYTDYKQLQKFEGRIFKKAIFHATTAGDVSKLKKHKDPKQSEKEGKFEIDGQVSVDYLGQRFELRRKDENTMLANDGPAYYNLGEMIEKSENGRSVSVDYLGQRFVLQRIEGDKMLVKIELEKKDGEKISMKDGPAYYITDKMWETVKYIEKVVAKTVFVKDHKEIWEEVVTGDIMEFEVFVSTMITFCLSTYYCPKISCRGL
ncbi:hypothetical protein SUGI_0096280 [Cryptomeria japonica]|nr:hypothetical protein SUGI_0096280 [Cryptomeria japonica]